MHLLGTGLSHWDSSFFDIASVIERAKHQHAFEYFADV